MSVAPPRFTRKRATSGRSRTIEQEFRHLDGLGKVQRQLAVTPARVDQDRIPGEQAADLLDHFEADGVVDLRHGAAADEKRRHPRRLPGVVERVEAAGPPVALLVDVGAGAQQHVDHLAILPLHSGQEGGLPERAAGIGLVDVRLQPGMLLEHAGYGRRVVRLDGGRERVGARYGHRAPAAHAPMRNAPILVE